jgi:hypothetical protein
MVEVMRLVPFLVLLAAGALATGCDKHKSVLDEGVSRRMAGGTRVIGPSEALRASSRARASWERELRKRAAADPATRFQNLPATELRRRLAAAAERYDFEVVSLELIHPRQLAPRVVVRTEHYLELAEATGGILRRLDPKSNTSDDRTGWRYEGFYFEAQDRDGVPFLIAFNYWRGDGPGGGQWARSERLFPFEHG